MDTSATRLVGRERHVTLLQDEITRTHHSHGRLLLVTGEAGVGKTALVTDALTAEVRQTALVSHGICWDGEGQPGYWPWLQVLRGLQRSVSTQEAADAEARPGGELAVLLGDATTAEAPPPAADLDFKLSDAVSRMLVALSRHRPVVIVLEDLHWADPASLRLLSFVASHTWFERVLVIGTFRNTELEVTGHPLQPLLGPLARKATTLELTGLDDQAVGLLLARVAGREPTTGLVAEVHRRTGGNPFFVEQMARLWLSTGSIDAHAPKVRDAIERRLGLLPEDVREVLTTAALLGPVLHRDLLTAAAGLRPHEVDHAVAEAITARLLTPAGDEHWEFVHDLVREALYDGLSRDDAIRRHAAVVAALKEHPHLGRDHPNCAARHAYLGVPAVPPDDAIDLLRAAAAAAKSRWALDEAVEHLRRALELAPPGRPATLSTLACDLSMSQWLHGDTAASLQTLKDVIGRLRQADDPVALAQVALWLRCVTWNLHTGESAELAVDLVNEAHRQLLGNGAGPPGASDTQREQELSAQMIALGRKTDDDKLLLSGLIARYCAIWRPGTAAERERIADEIVGLSRHSVDSTGIAAVSGPFYQFMARLELGESDWRDAVASTTVTLEAQPTVTYPVSADQGLLAAEAASRGSFDAAEAHLDEADRHALPGTLGRGEPNDRRVVRLQQRWTLALLRGRFDDAAAVAKAARAAGHPEPDLLSAVTASERGDLDVARRYLERVAAGEPTSRWFAALRLRLEAQVAAGSEDHEHCEIVRESLAPLHGQWVVAYPDVPHGPWVHWSAVLDAAQHRWDEAIAGFEAAAEAARSAQVRPWSVEARSRLAEARLRRNESGDASTARLLLTEVEKDATDLGMGHIVRRVRALSEERGTSAAYPALVGSNGHGGHRRSGPTEGSVPDSSAPGATIRFDGQVWVLTFGGRTAHLPDIKGLRDLQTLVRNPGAMVSAVDLVNPEGDAAIRAARAMGGDPVLDEQAKAAYRMRLADLDRDIDRALAQHDDQQAAKLDSERDTLINELRTAVGLGGRSRALGDEAERARKTVTARIRAAMQRIDEHHPELGEHLHASVSTGSTCSYRPRVTIDWAF